MKPIMVEVEIWAISDPELEEADVIFVKQFRISNFKIPRQDLISHLSSEAVKSEYPDYKYVGHKVLRYP